MGELGQYHWEALYGQATELPWNVNDLQCPFLPDINGHFSSATMKAYTGAIKLTYAKLQQAYANDPPASISLTKPIYDVTYFRAVRGANLNDRPEARPPRPWYVVAHIA